MSNSNTFARSAATPAARAWLSLIAVVLLAAVQFPIAVAQEPPRDRESDDRGDTKILGAEPKIIPPPERVPMQRWRLGVTVEPLDVGIRIQDVLPRSPAARAGLESNDIIVSVNGYQIGRVGGRLYPLEDELQRRADPQGRVFLLVQDRRSNRLVNVDVRLELADLRELHGVIRGTVDFRERVALPREAELHITLERRTFRGMEVIAEEVVRALPNPPIPFEMAYPLESVSPREDYYLSAEIRAGHQRLLRTERPEILRLDRQPSDVRLMLRREIYRVN